MQKTVYSFHPQTGEYLGPTQADRSPLDEGEVWLIPAYSTELKPPEAGEQQVAVFRDSKWALQADWRAVPLWSKQTALSMQPQIGDTPDSLGATTLEPPPYAVWKTNAWAVDQNAERSALIAAALQLQQQKLTAAYQVRRPLEDAVELGIASQSELAKLASWKQYCVDLSRVPTRPGYPAQIDWPKAP
ncbi:tail fiber assembly protein [Chromobacterium violaceum]|uniref:tail fiber assembly protein n=1 Tax=Chromobacterium violaceum TaxID=536 RepID=UPI001E4CD345|nr:tail fiber assembly protein [Chromobacterium violaceum]MCD0491421.1 tail fiber assembly protein [Chromobacterium violaceum]